MPYWKERNGSWFMHLAPAFKHYILAPKPYLNACGPLASHFQPLILNASSFDGSQR